jgi:single-strand DNA-binding protein
MRTTVTFEGRLAANPDLTITQNGKNIVEFTVAVNERRQVDGRSEDGDTTWHRVKAFKQLGENIVESLTQGDLVIVHGTTTTDTWTDKDKLLISDVRQNGAGPVRWRAPVG